MIATVCQRRDYCIRFEEVEGMTFVHAEVTRWNRQVMREFKLDLNDLLFLRGGPLYAMNGPQGKEKREKFMRMMGFQFLQEIPSPSGERDVFIRSK